MQEDSIYSVVAGSRLAHRSSSPSFYTQVTTLLVSHRFDTVYGSELAAMARAGGITLELLTLPANREARPGEADCARMDAAFFSGDVFPDFSRQFFSAVRKAPRLKWLHVFNVGVDHPVFHEMLARGVRLTTSAGSSAEPIAQTAIAGLLMLARNFPHWLDAQRNHAWAPLRGADVPRDLRGQTALVLGVGRIGAEFARLARVLGLKVIGVRRNAARASAAVDELHPPEQLPALLPHSDWLVITCPLNDETRGLITAERLARLPRGACVINVARGEIIDQQALMAALASGHLGGAYLDVFEAEPLPADSALWDMPNVIITPHNSLAASGNDRRVFEIFSDNLGRWSRGETLVNEVLKGQS
jgi:D-2-hydroxyacid dehydrogenase (NADP+)